MTSNEPLILIIDDIPSFREIVKDMLVDIGFSNFDEANDGAEALKHIETRVPALILSDYMMPNVNGLELLKRLNVDNNATPPPFIMITAVSEKGIVDEALSSGASAVITKPLNFSTFRSTVLKSLSDLVA